MSDVGIVSGLRTAVDRKGWRAATGRLEDGQASLVDLWGEPGAAHMAIRAQASGDFSIVTLATSRGMPSVGAGHPPAIRLERSLRDLHGVKLDGALDTRSWLDHGRWGGRSLPGSAVYDFLPADGDDLHQIPVGPVHAGIIEPGHFRFTASGETVVRLEQRFGYVHRGVEDAIAGQPIEQAARVAGRVSGDSTVAYAWAFARAVEAATGLEPPPRATWLRALMAEVERLANHLGDIGAVCNDAAFGLMHAHCGVLREQVLRAAEAVFGHRLMMDCIIPGGVKVDPGSEAMDVLAALACAIGPRFERLVELYDGTASLQDRTAGAGVVKPALVNLFAAGGFVGRASGRSFDARKALPYAPYDVLDFDAPVLEAGDVDARVRIRIEEVRQSLKLVSQITGRMPEGPVIAALPAFEGEGAVMVEGFRGDIFAWVRTDGRGGVSRARLRDPSWFQWPLLEAAIEGNIVADFPLCNKSFNCSYAGVDL